MVRASLLLVLMTMLAPLPAQAGTKLYRYSLVTRSCSPNQYRTELSGTPVGLYYAVETDASGRVIGTSVYRQGKKVSEGRYRYSGDSRNWAGGDDYAAGEKTGSWTIDCDKQGRPVRRDQFTDQGVRTGYSLYAVTADSEEIASYTADGKKTDSSLHRFNPATGVLSGSRDFKEGDRIYKLRAYDGSTGLETERRQLFTENDELQTLIKSTYDGNGEKQREDGYGKDGQWYAANEFSSGLITRKTYKFVGGDTKDIRYTFDEKRWRKDGVQYVNDKFVCKFTYDYLPDGTVKRTLALGPDGELWAEYPDKTVVEVSKDGQPVNGSGGLIHHAGDWW